MAKGKRQMANGLRLHLTFAICLLPFAMPSAVCAAQATDLPSLNTQALRILDQAPKTSAEQKAALHQQALSVLTQRAQALYEHIRGLQRDA